MSKQLFLNNFTTVFAASVKDSPTSGTPATELDYGILRLSDGAAGVLVNPAAGGYYILTAYKKSGSVESAIEIMQITAVDNSVIGECRITVTRAQDGTSLQAYVSGDYVSLRLTKGGMVNLLQSGDKDISGGVPGLTLFKLNLRNAANTLTSWFTTAATVARTWTLPDKDGTVAMTSDITGTNSGVNTGDQTSITGNAATATALSAGDDRTKLDGIAAGATANAGDVTLAGAQTLTNKTINLANNTATVDGTEKIGYLGVPQNSKSAAYTLVLSDAGKHVLHPSADTPARIFTIPANASVAYPIGTAVTFVNQASAGALTISIATDVMRLAGAGTTGSCTLAANGIATAIKVTTTEWLISGVNLT